MPVTTVKIAGGAGADGDLGVPVSLDSADYVGYQYYILLISGYV
jgi:hypothetical protein